MTQLLETTSATLPVARELLTVIIPTLNEAKRLPAVLKQMGEADVQVIVADGGSTDGSLDIAAEYGATIVHSEPGRDKQLNAGAGAAEGETLLFLHADTLLPQGFDQQVTAALNQPGVVAGAFRFQLDDRRLMCRAIEHMVHLRCKLFGLPYGDQALFMRRSIFEQIGGFPAQPVMEDVAMVRTLRRRGRVYICEGSAVTSARRWRKGGFVRVAIFNQLAVIAYLLGVSPKRIAAWRP